MMNDNWDDMILSLLKMTQEHEHAPTWAKIMKLSEEVGEFNEVMLHEYGFLKHKNKEWKDTPIEEAADIMNTVMGILSKHYPDKTPEEISEELLMASKKKGNKYARILGAEEIFT